MPMALFQPPRTALSAGAKLPSGVAVSPGRLVIAGNSNAKPYRGLTRINADQGQWVNFENYSIRLGERSPNDPAQLGTPDLRSFRRAELARRATQVRKRFLRKLTLLSCGNQTDP